MLAYVLLSCLLFLSSVKTEIAASQNKWVILVAGSNGWVNYRHQADVAHAYRLLRANGIPADRIITFAYDDIARNRQNPYPGQIFNNYDHIDFYKGLVIDYRGQEVSADIFVRVLLGDPTLKSHGRKVLQSTSNDNVFVYFSSHGKPLKIDFPNSDLDARKFVGTLIEMYKKKMYKNMVIYAEACNSGSLFALLLPKDINVYATTAASELEPSYGTFCADPRITTCLADDYSNNWIMDTVKHDPRTETLQQQFNVVRSLTLQSTPKEYGSRATSLNKVAEFQGSMRSNVNRSQHTKTKDYIPSSAAHIHSIMQAVRLSDTNEEKSLETRRLMRAVKLGELADETMNLIVDTISLTAQQSINPLNTTPVEEGISCYLASDEIFEQRCFSTQRVPEVAQQLQKLLNLCQIGVPTSKIIDVIENVCL